MSLTSTEKLGFLKHVAEFIDKNALALQAPGFDPVARAAGLRQLGDELAQVSSAQDGLKAQLLKQTQLVKDTLRRAYVAASGNVDAVAGVIGKDTEMAHIVRRLRSAIRRGAIEAATPATK